MIYIFNGILFVSLVSVVLFSNLFKFSTSFSFLKSLITNLVSKSLFMNFIHFFLYILFVSLVTWNILGNIPLASIPSLFYSETLTLSLMFWLPLMFCVSLTQAKEFLAHMLPFGAPVSLMLFLPIIEIFSQLIRPFTLMIRISTNLSAGHIMMYMFSYFTLLSKVLAPFIYTVISILFVLEMAISILQAYIFVSLLALYFDETY